MSVKLIEPYVPESVNTGAVSDVGIYATLLLFILTNMVIISHLFDTGELKKLQGLPEAVTTTAFSCNAKLTIYTLNTMAPHGLNEEFDIKPFL